MNAALRVILQRGSLRWLQRPLLLRQLVLQLHDADVHGEGRPHQRLHFVVGPP